MARWKVAGICFEHMHMGDLLRMVHEHPEAEIAAICDVDPEAMADAAEALAIPEDRMFTDHRTCIEDTHPDLVILCPATARHAEWTEAIAPFGAPILMEKPFAASLAEADRMIAAMNAAGQPLFINWPLRWYPSHATAKRLVDEGAVGAIEEVHYYDGNRGPLWHLADKVETDAAYVAREKGRSWFYKQAEGGGSLQDYLGYGATLGTWYLEGDKPREITAITDDPPGLEVDEHSITIARYDRGLSKFETRWGTFTDPWSHQPQPKCGFVLKGRRGTLSSYDFEATVRLQTEDHPEGRDIPVDRLAPPYQNPVQYVLSCLGKGRGPEGPLDPALCRIGQQIVDSAVLSAREKRTVSLLD